MSKPQPGEFPDTRWTLVQRAVVKGDANAFKELKGFLVDHYRHSIAAKRDHRKNNYLNDPDHHESLSAGLVNWSIY